MRPATTRQPVGWARLGGSSVAICAFKNADTKMRHAHRTLVDAALMPVSRMKGHPAAPGRLVRLVLRRQIADVEVGLQQLLLLPRRPRSGSKVRFPGGNGLPLLVLREQDAAAKAGHLKKHGERVITRGDSYSPSALVIHSWYSQKFRSCGICWQRTTEHL